MLKQDMFIAGKWVQSKSLQTMIDIVNPANEEVFATVPKANKGRHRHSC
jgi:acyl-CoA reductase-like NAD-dependent aldehyde dehydrogenase